MKDRAWLEFVLGITMLLLVIGIILTGLAALCYVLRGQAASGDSAIVVADGFHGAGLFLFVRTMFLKRSRLLAALPVALGALLWSICIALKFFGALPSLIPELAYTQFFLYASIVALGITIVYLRKIEIEREQRSD